MFKNARTFRGVCKGVENDRKHIQRFHNIFVCIFGERILCMVCGNQHN